MTPDPAASYHHCEQQLRAEDHDLWLAALFAPAAARPHLHALGAFALEVGHVRGRVRQPVAGEIRLQWWQEVIDGERGAEAAAHPVAAALVATMASKALPRAPFEDLLDAARGALYDEPPADTAALGRILAALHGSPIRLAAFVLGSGAELDCAAHDAGVALGLTALLAETGHPEIGHRVLLPTDLLARHRIEQGAADRGPTPARRALVADLVALARSRMAALRRRRAELGEAGPAFLITAAVEPRLVSQAKRLAGTSPAARDASRLRRQWRMWRAARRGGVL